MLNKLCEFKNYITVSFLVSVLIGLLSYIWIKPSNMRTVKSIIEGVDGPTLTATVFGFDFIICITIISFIVILIIYKPFIRKFVK